MVSRKYIKMGSRIPSWLLNNSAVLNKNKMTMSDICMILLSPWQEKLWAVLEKLQKSQEACLEQASKKVNTDIKILQLMSFSDLILKI